MSVASRTLHGVNVCLIPSPYNDDRPLVLRHRPLAAVSSALIAVKLIALLTVALVPTSAELSVITENRIVQLTNAERTAAGYAALTPNAKLAAAAEEKGKHMLEQDYFAHISPSGVTPWFWIKKHQYSYVVAGENLAIDFTEAEDVVAAWMASPTHKANILHSEYTETGVAVVSGEFQGGTSIIVVHMFGNPAGGTTASAPAATPTPQTAGTQQPASPSPTPTPTPTSTPTSTPVPVQSQTPTVPPSVAPRVPRIAVDGDPTATTTVHLSITGEGGSTVYIVANGAPTGSVELPSGGSTTTTVDISSLPDGPIVLRAYATAHSRQSQLSESVAITKDTTGPALALEQLTFIISPAFDRAQASVEMPSRADETDIRVISALEPHVLSTTDELGNTSTLSDVSITPAFDDTSSTQELRAPSRMLSLSRRMALSVFSVITVLLILTVFVRVHVQKPALITHATAVALLAGVLFLI